MDLIALEDFLLVARYGGLSAAARASSRSKATLSRQVMRLEDSLGIRLVERGTSRLRLTPEGEILQARAEGIFSEFRDLEAAMQGKGREPEGRLRLSAPLLFSHLYLGKLAAAFREKYPKVLLEAHVEDRQVDLVEEEFDVVIRVNPRSVHGLVGKRFRTDQLVLVIRPDLYRQRGGSASESLPAILLSSQKADPCWHVTMADGVKRIDAQLVMQLPSYFMIHAAVLSGAGASAMPRSIVEEDLQSGALLSLGELEGGATEIWVLHSARRLASPRVVAFVQFIGDYFDTGYLPKSPCRQGLP